MTLDEANKVGVSAGQIALGEYILRNFKGQMSPMLEKFLDKVVNIEYGNMSELSDYPAEDIALKVGELFKK